MAGMYYLMMGEWPTIEVQAYTLIIQLIILVLLLPYTISIIKKERKRDRERKSH